MGLGIAPLVHNYCDAFPRCAQATGFADVDYILPFFHEPPRMQKEAVVSSQSRILILLRAALQLFQSVLVDQEFRLLLLVY